MAEVLIRNGSKRITAAGINDLTIGPGFASASKIRGIMIYASKWPLSYRFPSAHHYLWFVASSSTGASGNGSAIGHGLWQEDNQTTDHVHLDSDYGTASSGIFYVLHEDPTIDSATTLEDGYAARYAMIAKTLYELVPPIGGEQRSGPRSNR